MSELRHLPRTPWPVIVALVVLVIPACRVTELQLWHPGELPPDACAVKHVHDVVYVAGPTADPEKHRLDLFLPEGRQDFPVVVLVHGGAWMVGDNCSCGLYSSIGEHLAREGIGVVMPNYRLSPWVKHPEHVRDVARAVAWTKAHIAEHGGDLNQLFLAGHSAGGHLVALLATDEQYLKATGLRTADIKGVIGISGVYRIPNGDMAFSLGGPTASAFRLDQMLPLRGGRGSHPSGLPGIPLKLDIFAPAFGTNPEVRAQASPVNHVRPGLPPFLLFHAENDLPTLPQMAEELHHNLRAQGCQAHLLRIDDRNHNSIVFRAITRSDPVARAVVEFVRGHAVGQDSNPAEKARQDWNPAPQPPTAENAGPHVSPPSAPDYNKN